MPAQLGVRRGTVMRDHATAQPASSGERGAQTSMTGDNPEEHAVRRLEDLVDETLKASFPASDPPSWTLGGSQPEFYGPEDLDK